MKILRGLSAGLCLMILLTGILVGCTQKAAPSAPPAIQYQIGKGAEISKVTWYMLEGVLCFDIEVKNVASTNQTFEVGVSVDKDPFFTTGLEAAKPVKPGAKQIYKAGTVLDTPYPKDLSIRVVTK